MYVCVHVPPTPSPGFHCAERGVAIARRLRPKLRHSNLQRNLIKAAAARFGFSLQNAAIVITKLAVKICL